MEKQGVLDIGTPKSKLIVLWLSCQDERITLSFPPMMSPAQRTKETKRLSLKMWSP